MKPAARTSIATVIGCAVVATLGAGVGAVAATKTTSVKACETTKGFLVGASKNKCPTGSKKITVNQQGKRGPAGPKGKSGANANVTALAAPDLASTANLAGTVTMLQIVNAPVGKYVVSYEVNFLNLASQPSDGAAEVQCTASTSAAGSPGSNIQVDPGKVVTATGVAALTVTSPATITVSCTAFGSSTVQPQNGTLIAVPVSAVTASS